MLQIAPSLADQIYDAIVSEICDGRLAPEIHLVQERLAERFGVSRQPIQQAMARLKADGMVEERGMRGLFVTRLDPEKMQQHYDIRGALDGWAAKTAAQRLAGDPALAARVVAEGAAILEEGEAAIAAGNVAEQVRLDSAFHFMIYAASGNPMVATTAEPHWRFLRRAMYDVLRRAQAPKEVWRQHAAILEAVAAGDSGLAEERAGTHVELAATLLARVLADAAREKGAQ